MKRDWECIRAILVKLEELPDSMAVLQPRDVQGWTVEEVSDHLRMLDEAGLIRAKCHPTGNAPLFCLGFGLTWEGHELLDSMRKPEVWHRIRSAAAEKGLELSFEAIRAVGTWAMLQVLHGRAS